MPRQAVRTHQRTGKDGTKHTVRRHSRDSPGARKASTFGFQPLTPARASAGALVGSAAYWTFSGTMSLIAAIGWSITAACAALMGYDAVRKQVRKRKAAGGKRSVARLRAKVKWDNTKQKVRTTKRRAKVFLSKRQERAVKWRKQVRKMPLGRRFNPAYRVRRWWRFRMGEYKVAARKRVDGWLEKVYSKVYKTERASTTHGKRKVAK